MGKVNNCQGRERGEMAPTMYAHVNKLIKKIKRKF
jgi:hypothetical protein